MRNHTVLAMNVLFGLLVLAPASPDYDTARAAAIGTCEAIDPGKYQSGLIMNPDGYRSYYERSACFQKAAVEFRDLKLCHLVRRRWSLLSSSWGYSTGNCRTLVTQAEDADRREFEDLKRQYASGRMELRDFAISRNGNGRDYDVIPAFVGTNGHGYTIALEILPPVGSPVVIHSNGYYVDPRSGLRLFIPQHDIRSRFPAFEPGRTYQVRAAATFTLPAGGGSRFISDAFVERVFPLRERMQTIVRQIRF